jgi:hypothetical protein
MQTQTALRFCLTPVRISTINNTYKDKCWQGCEGKKEPSYTIGGNVN